MNSYHMEDLEQDQLNPATDVPAAIGRPPYLFLGVSIMVAAVILSATFIYMGPRGGKGGAQDPSSVATALAAEVLPAKGVVLPAVWGDIGKQLTESGTIDLQAFKEAYADRGGLSEEALRILSGAERGKIRINQANAGELLNILWAFGLGNKNPILEKGEMQDPRYGGAGRFASTGGWTLARGPAMDHYSMHGMVGLTGDQQALVERVSQGIYRPCCGNSAHFPDCNHGMAMLGLLQLMAANGASEEEMYRAALAVNSYWFPENYMTIAAFLKEQGTDWQDADPKSVLGAAYSSSVGYRKVVESTTPPAIRSSGGSCGV